MLRLDSDLHETGFSDALKGTTEEYLVFFVVIWVKTHVPCDRLHQFYHLLNNDSHRDLDIIGDFTIFAVLVENEKDLELWLIFEFKEQKWGG